MNYIAQPTLSLSTYPTFVQRDETYQRGSGIDPSGSLIIGGKIRSEPPHLFLL